MFSSSSYFLSLEANFIFMPQTLTFGNIERERWRERERVREKEREREREREREKKRERERDLPFLFKPSTAVWCTTSISILSLTWRPINQRSLVSFPCLLITAEPAYFSSIKNSLDSFKELILHPRNPIFYLAISKRFILWDTANF